MKSNVLDKIKELDEATKDSEFYFDNKNKLVEKGDKMNGTVYLRNGQAAEFVKQVDEENYIVHPHMIFLDEEGNEDYYYDQKIVVSEVFQNPPVERISADYIKKIEAVKAKNDELLAITREIHSVQYALKKAKELITNLEKGVINKTELKNAERKEKLKEDIIKKREELKKLESNL